MTAMKSLKCMQLSALAQRRDDVMFAKSQEIFLIEDLKMHMSISSALQVI